MPPADLDDVLTGIGLGRWQILHILAFITNAMVSAPAVISSALTNAQVNFRCLSQTHSKSAKIFDNQCYEDVLEIVSFSNTSFALNWNNTEYMADEVSPDGTKLSLPGNESSCSSWEYDTSVFTSTISMEWNLICEDAWLSPLYQVAFTVGQMIGDVVAGVIGDRLGRIFILRYGTLLTVVFILGIGLSPSYWIVLLCRFLLGMATTSTLYSAFNLVMEVTPTDKRATVGLFIWFPYSGSISILAGLGHFLRDWRTLHLASSAFALLALPIGWLADESPRWLAQRGLSRRAKEILQKAAAWNRTTLPDDSRLDEILQSIAEDGNKGRENQDDCDSSCDFLKVVFKSKPLAVISLAVSAIAFVIGANYLGIPLGVSDAGGNPFLYLAITGGVEFLTALLGSVFAKRFHRTRVMLFTCFTAACFRFALLAVPEDAWGFKWLFLVLSMVVVNTAYLMSLVWTAELYPTVVRAQGNSVYLIFNHLGYLVVPFITDYLSQSFSWLPDIIFGLTNVFAVLVTLLLPETKGLSLCDTVGEVEERWKSNKDTQQKQDSKSYFRRILSRLT